MRKIEEKLIEEERQSLRKAKGVIGGLIFLKMNKNRARTQAREKFFFFFFFFF